MASAVGAVAARVVICDEVAAAAGIGAVVTAAVVTGAEESVEGFEPVAGAAIFVTDWAAVSTGLVTNRAAACRLPLEPPLALAALKPTLTENRQRPGKRPNPGRLRHTDNDHPPGGYSRRSSPKECY